MINDSNCSICFTTGLDHRGRYCECPWGQSQKRHVHVWNVEVCHHNWELWRCYCGETKKVYDE